MEQTLKIKLPFLDTRLFITISIACLIFIAVLWYDSSPSSYNSYHVICTSNYGKVSEYNDCMKPFYNQSNIDRLGMFGAAVVFFACTAIFIYQRFKKVN